MLLHLTLVDARTGGERPVEVRAAGHHTAADLLTELGVPAGSSLHVEGAPLPVDAPVGQPPLLDGSMIVLGRPGQERRTGRAPLRLSTVAGPDAGRSLELTHGEHVVGRGDAATLRLADPALSREHLALTVDRDGVLVRDLATTNGTLVDGAPVPSAGHRVPVGGVLRAGRTTFVIEARRSRPRRRQPTGVGTLAVNPTPHVPGAPVAPTIRVPEEPRRPRRRPMPWLMVLAPLPIAGIMALVLGPRMLLLGLMTPLLVIASTLADRSGSKREHREAHAEWRATSGRCARRLESALTAERRARLQAAPDPRAVLDAALGHDRRLWQRRPEHEEYLHLRIGLGDTTARVLVENGTGSREHPVIRDVPIVVDLPEVGVVGVAGPRQHRDRVARHLLGQLVALHSHHDLRLSVLAADEGWSAPFARLVHLREHDDVPGSARAAGSPESATALLAAHAAIVRERGEAARASGTDRDRGPDLVLVVDDCDRWRTDANLRTVLADGPGLGVHVIVLADSPEQLPHEVAAVVELDRWMDRVRVRGMGTTGCTADAVGPGWARRLTSALVPLRDATPSRAGGALPTESRLIDLLDLDPDDLDTIRGWWSRERTGPSDLEVIIGAGTDGAHRIDLRRDGPHALVAGTTGSGKSEFLQSWVASLAVRLSPEEITFVLVDYKGGSAFAACADLPHTVGVLTDLDPEGADRALSSLDAELTRRERILATSGAKDVDDHRGEALPRLLIVVDEFRMLAEEQPEALARLMRIATVGRSLGVHLVLATQRPGGIVSADIKANVNLRIALRVRDRVDSEDVIGCRDAVNLPEEAPGRALARTGGGPARSFQTGRVAGSASTTGDALMVRAPGGPWPAPLPIPEPGPSDLQRLATTLTRAATDLGIPRPHRPWLPPLPEVLTDVDLAAHRDEGGGAPFGVVDLPREQRQVPLHWSPANGNWLVIGGPATGRTTTLASLVTSAARTYPPDRLHVQVVGDGSAALAGLRDLPHVGSVVDGEDLPVLRRFLTQLDHEVRQRRQALRGVGHPTLDAWWEAVRDDRHQEAPPPHLLIVIDGWGRISRPAGTVDDLAAAETLETVLRDGTAVGVRVVATGGRELLTGRIGSLVANRLVLHLPDRADAALAGLPRTVVSTRPVPGRGHVHPGGHEVQVAMPSATQPAPRRVPGRTEQGGPGPAAGPVKRPWVVTPLPERVMAADLPGTGPGEVPIGVGGRGGDLVTWAPGTARRLLVCGPAGSGRSTALSTIAGALARDAAPVIVIGEAVDGHGITDRLTAHDREELLELRRRHPDLAVVVDDLDRLEEAPVADVLREIMRRVEVDQGVVVAACSNHAAMSIRGLVADVGRGRAGVLLQPSGRGDGDVLGLRVPALPRIPGRGHLIVGGRAREVQLALPDRASPGGVVVG